MSKKLVYGAGIYDKGEFAGSEKVGNKWVATKEYVLWNNMLKRCCSEKFQLKRPTYDGCYSSDNFKNFQLFAEWCQSQTGFKMKDYHLDKDMLINGNKCYSEDNCVFVPRQLNIFLTNMRSDQGNCPVGVSFHKRDKHYRAMMCIKGKSTYLGYYSTPEEAFNVYKTAKEARAKELAIEYAGLVDPRVIDALNRYVVE